LEEAAIRVSAEPVGNVAVDVWNANRQAAFFRRAFGRTLTIQQC
jgi:hypothetical protein